jgi:hypothetical protein
VRDIIIASITGFLSSILASYLYAQIVASRFGFKQMAIFTGAAAFITFLIIKLLPRIRLVLGSGITAYYPHGQSQYMKTLLNDLQHSKTLKVIGARGLDLIGERSPIGSSLEERHWQGELEAFLISPDSSHARLRVNHLAVEKEKYKTECKMVDSFLGVLALRHAVQVTKYEYDGEPVFRAIILDSCAYVSLYQAGVQGRLLPCFRLRSVRDPLFTALIGYTKHLRAIASHRVYSNGGGTLRNGQRQLNSAEDSRVHTEGRD